MKEIPFIGQDFEVVEFHNNGNVYSIKNDDDIDEEYEKNEKKKAVNATKREHKKKIDDIKNDKIKKSLLELSKIFKPK